MNRFDRMLGILLLLRSGKSVAADDLARRFEVSRRTIYRDMDTLSVLGVPVFAERGREGGFQLLEGYFLPPLMFSTGEAVSLILGLSLWRSLRSQPLLADIDAAERKLLAVMPPSLRDVLSHAQQIVGFEEQPPDIFHPEPEDQQVIHGSEPSDVARNAISGTFLHAILNRQKVRFTYRSPYRSREDEVTAVPQGMFSDRGRWYMVGLEANRARRQRIWRADRIRDMRAIGQAGQGGESFDVRKMLGRQWLRTAMDRWSRDTPVRIRLTQAQAERLQQDWYYRFAKFESCGDGGYVMTYGEENSALVFALLRWLGPGAELLEPTEWRMAFAE
jgi:predicted DNA-binding transcriptional regulator YafY